MPVKIGYELLYETQKNTTALNFLNELDGYSRKSVEETFPTVNFILYLTPYIQTIANSSDICLSLFISFSSPCLPFPLYTFHAITYILWSLPLSILLINSISVSPLCLISSIPPSLF